MPEHPSDLSIRPAHPEHDLEALILSFEQRAYFADRLSRQKAGIGVLLVAWLSDQVIGDAYLWLEEAEEPDLRHHIPRVPLLTHVEVHPDHRSLGFGTKLITFAEDVLRERGYEQVALAVEVTNVRAAALYGRLGYSEWPYGLIHCQSFEEGVVTPEVCQVMVKKLS